jgi:uncharacterized protein
MDLQAFSPELLLALFAIAMLAGCLDTLAGGGGLITLPVLILTGLPPLQAIGTNKLQGSMGTATATLMMLRHSRVTWSDVKWLMLGGFIGSATGSVLVQFVETELLGVVIPVVLVCIGVYFLFAGKLLEHTRPTTVDVRTFGGAVVPAIGCYDGMFGPGTGSFFALAGVALRGNDLRSATATAKTLNFSTNIASLLVFVIAGQIVWSAGLVMMAGQAAGAWIGSHVLFRIDLQFLRVVIVVMCLAMLTRYFWSLA